MEFYVVGQDVISGTNCKLLQAAGRIFGGLTGCQSRQLSKVQATQATYSDTFMILHGSGKTPVCKWTIAGNSFLQAGGLPLPMDG